MLSSTPGPYTLMSIILPPVVTTKLVSRYCQITQGAKSSSVGNHWFRESTWWTVSNIYIKLMLSSQTPHVDSVHRKTSPTRTHHAVPRQRGNAQTGTRYKTRHECQYWELHVPRRRFQLLGSHATVNTPRAHGTYLPELKGEHYCCPTSSSNERNRQW